MRIGVNLLYVLPGVVGGTETYAAGLLDGLARVAPNDQFIVFLNQESRDWSLPGTANIHRFVCPIAAVDRPRRYIFEQLRLPALLKEYRVDAVHSLGYVSPLITPCPSVVSIPDLNFRAFGDKIPLVRRLALQFFVSQSARRASHVIAISQFSKAQLVDLLGIAPEKVSVTLLAPRPRCTTIGDSGDTLSRLGIGPRFAFAFSSTSPNKNIPRLLDAWRRARSSFALPHQLVLVGHAPPEIRSAELGQDGSVVVTGYLDQPSLETVLSKAEMLIFPSTYEGFGFPTIEAMSRGIPVVCSNQASLPEVAGDAAVFFDPYSVDDMAEAIARIALSPEMRADLRCRGYMNAARFSWENTARATLQVYRTIASHSEK